MPGKQTTLNLLASWISMAQAAGFEIEQLYSPERRRFTVRVHGIQMQDDQLIVEETE